ncbi:MAG: GNAT family N-acetyltransferase [Thiohalomonadales bacterium]
MKLTIVEKISDIAAAQWNALSNPLSPFIRHEFLCAMETHHCVGEHSGWIPHHVALYAENDELLAAAPMYLKYNSYGEFVFDWSWADAYRCSGLHYYPKLVMASPYSPVPGARILLRDHNDNNSREIIVKTIKELADKLKLSSIHCLFGPHDDHKVMLQQGFALRHSYQFHWHNHNYKDFDDFLQYIRSRKRKNIRREREKIAASGIRFEVRFGQDITESQWRQFHLHYCSTFDRLGGYPSFTLEFFQTIAASMGDQVMLVAAYLGQRQVASAFCLQDQDSLYGRHWGCDDSFDGLHFETCYYQGIEHCIARGLSRFEPGVQGEHKISRGFLPSMTYSAHYIHHPEFREIINGFLQQEERQIKQYFRLLEQRSPFKTD